MTRVFVSKKASFSWPTTREKKTNEDNSVNLNQSVSYVSIAIHICFIHMAFNESLIPNEFLCFPFKKKHKRVD